MKLFRLIFVILLALILLLTAAFFWVRSGSFTYDSSQEKEFQINAPISVVCKRALSAKEFPRDADGTQTKVDMKKAVQNFAIGDPIECEVNHPILGKMIFRFKITLKIEDGVFNLKGETVSIEPNLIRHKGMVVASLEKVGFQLGIEAKGAQSAGLFDLLPSTGTTLIHFSSFTNLKVHFREYSFIRGLVDQVIAKTQKKILTQIDSFIQTNLMQPGPQEKTTDAPAATESAAPSETAKPKKRVIQFLKKAGDGLLKQGSDTENPTENAPDEDDLDLSVLDEEP